MGDGKLTRRGTDTLATVLLGHAARTPDAPFLVFERAPGRVEHTTYREQAERAARTAATLARHGVRAGERFCVNLTNRPEFYDLWFGAAFLGATIVPVNPLSTVDELGYLVRHAGCEVVVTQSDLVGTAHGTGAAKVLDVDAPWLAEDALDQPAATDPASTLGVLYTSGTTSRPKGVEVSHAAYLFCGDAVAGHLRVRPDDRQLIVLPLFHGNAQYYSTMSALVTGASIALAPRFSASRWSTQAATLGATVASLFAAPIRMILAADPDDNDTAHALRVVMFAQNVTDQALATFERRFAVPLVQLYGMTETVVPPTINPLYEDRRGRSIGRPLPGITVRVAGPDDEDVPFGEPGELLVHGEPGRTIMTRYLHDPEATATTLRDGWLHTGDTVTLGADGYLAFVDRRKDMIKRAGENVASGEVERVVDEHPAVFESAAVGVPDEMRDEAIHVYVVRHRGASLEEEELLAHCRERMAKFRVPDRVIFVDDLPRTSVGKIQKHLIRRREGQHP
ncbi:AMP-binding protein [Amycolatopsis acididurans]|uniref:AMP-binding protein n=1 Tax=Amycolatopsis acididurans TaxID=2724524 RepID=UPI001B3333B6|nr:AMP-binding protein [Amycolatopsis acididurans]